MGTSPGIGMVWAVEPTHPLRRAPRGAGRLEREADVPGANRSIPIAPGSSIQLAVDRRTFLSRATAAVVATAGGLRSRPAAAEPASSTSSEGRAGRSPHDRAPNLSTDPSSPVALAPSLSMDRIQYVSKSPLASDLNSGLSWGAAVASIAQAKANLNSTTGNGIIYP